MQTFNLPGCHSEFRRSDRQSGMPAGYQVVTGCVRSRPRPPLLCRSTPCPPSRLGSRAGVRATSMHDHPTIDRHSLSPATARDVGKIRIEWHNLQRQWIEHLTHLCFRHAVTNIVTDDFAEIHGRDRRIGEHRTHSFAAWFSQQKRQQRGGVEHRRAHSPSASRRRSARNASTVASGFPRSRRCVSAWACATTSSKSGCGFHVLRVRPRHRHRARGPLLCGTLPVGPPAQDSDTRARTPVMTTALYLP